MDKIIVDCDMCRGGNEADGTSRWGWKGLFEERVFGLRPDEKSEPARVRLVRTFQTEEMVQARALRQGDIFEKQETVLSGQSSANKAKNCLK